MKKLLGFVFLILILIGGILISGCGKQNGDSSGERNKGPTVSLSNLFDVSGAKAIATASSANTVSGSAIKTFSANNVTELLKLNSSGEISSVLSSALASQWHPPISVIETGPDGSLYIGFQWGIWVSSTTSAETQASFFKITTSGSIEIVDSAVYGIGTWYGGSENGELPAKQVQFDSAGTVYYLGKTSAGNTILKKKTTAGVISQIGSSNYEVRDFLVTPGGFIIFHGSNVGNWSIEWLRVINGSTVSNIFYNDGAGYLRAYYYYNYETTNYIFLIGENLTLLDENSVPKKYSGITRVTLSSAGLPTAVEALYDDKNMYNETYNTIGSQLTWGYWDPTDMINKKFFSTNNYGQVVLPLSLEAGVTEAAIRSFVRTKYQSITTDTLNDITFAGLAATLESWQVNSYLDDIIAANLSGKTWSKWREENGLSGVQFGNAKQLVFAPNGKLYAVMRLDSWGAGSSKGDKLFQVINEYGGAEITVFPQDTTNYYKSMSKVRAYGNYAVYLSNKVGSYKIYRLDLTNSSASPIDMIPSKSNIEIFNFDYDATTGLLYFDVYDLSNNTSYLAQQALTSTVLTSQVSAGTYTITDIVPFQATK
ncbi:MAG: hypothetical protein FD145_330 [Candidatus Saganbacteria bacterium]|uniref:Uncharacterized protein n=1 Tax=Candidatus Saganbacteria bacterium TaxID=2575572 RepID=A0A833P3J5_UNCSA|nr:MAG: hypothetical protein FD145_330 [Candidatus Saganbacteria bacterium]